MMRTVSLMLIACMYPTVGLGQVKARPKGVASRQTRKQSGTPAVNDPQWLRDRLEKVRRRYDLPDLGAAIVVGDKVVAASAVGVRKYGTNIAVTQDDPFHLGSITKVMTATLIGMMIDDGVLRLEHDDGGNVPGTVASDAAGVSEGHSPPTVIAHRRVSFLAQHADGPDHGARQERRRPAVRLCQGGYRRPAPGRAGYKGHL